MWHRKRTTRVKRRIRLRVQQRTTSLDPLTRHLYFVLTIGFNVAQSAHEKFAVDRFDDDIFDAHKNKFAVTFCTVFFLFVHLICSKSSIDVIERKIHRSLELHVFCVCICFLSSLVSIVLAKVSMKQNFIIDEDDIFVWIFCSSDDEDDPMTMSLSCGRFKSNEMSKCEKWISFARNSTRVSSFGTHQNDSTSFRLRKGKIQSFFFFLCAQSANYLIEKSCFSS